MDRVSTSGQMVDNTKVITMMTKRRGMVSTHIQMAAVTRETGKVANNTERAFSSAQKVSKERENGKMERDFIGSTRWTKDTIKEEDPVLEVTEYKI